MLHTLTSAFSPPSVAMPLCTSLMAAGCSMQIMRWSGMSIQGHDRAWRGLNMWMVGGGAQEVIVVLRGGGTFRGVVVIGSGQGNVMQWGLRQTRQYTCNHMQLHGNSYNRSAGAHVATGITRGRSGTDQFPCLGTHERNNIHTYTNGRPTPRRISNHRRLAVPGV